MLYETKGATGEIFRWKKCAAGKAYEWWFYLLVLLETAV